jgi:hypothetical protein
MNFQTFLEELDRLYEADEKKVEAEEVVEESAAEEAHLEEPLTEAADEEVAVEEEPEEEAAPEEEPVAQRLILECSNCGALMIKDEADVVVDAESDLANVEEACQYCEEAAGYVITGVVAPYEAAEAEIEIEDEAEENVESEVEEVIEEALDGISNFPNHDKYINHKGMIDAAEKLTNYFTAKTFTFKIDAGDEYAVAHLPKVLKSYYGHVQVGYQGGLAYIHCADPKYNCN